MADENFTFFKNPIHNRNRIKCGRAVLAEWLRRWTWNPMGSPRVGSNPADSVPFF